MDPTMVEEKLVHPIVSARTLPRGDGRGGKHTHAGQINLLLLILYSLLFEYDVFTPVSVTLFKNPHLDFLYSKALFTALEGRMPEMSYCDTFLTARRLPKLSTPHPPYFLE